MNQPQKEEMSQLDQVVTLSKGWLQTDFLSKSRLRVSKLSPSVFVCSVVNSSISFWRQ